MIKWLDKFLKCFSFELLKPHRIWSESWRRGSENRRSELRGWNKVRVKRVPQACPCGWSEREFQSLKETPRNQREMIPQQHSAKLSGEHQANFETLWSPAGDWWFPAGGKEDRALPRRGWKLGAVGGARRPFWSSGGGESSFLHWLLQAKNPKLLSHLHWCFTFINTGFSPLYMCFKTYMYIYIYIYI